MKMYDNGVLRDMTQEEEAIYLSAQSEPEPETPESRLAALESQIAALKAELGLE